MKRNLSEALKGLDEDPFAWTDTDRKEAKVRQLLDESRAAKKAASDKEIDAKATAIIKEATEDAINLIALREYVLEKHPYCAWVGGLNDEGNPFYKVLIETPPKLIALMDADKTTFMTNRAMWADTDQEKRRELIERFGLPEWVEDMQEIDPFELLPPGSKQHVLDWQLQINTGGAYAASEMVGSVADSMIARGYCLHAPNAIMHRLLEDDDKHTRQPGRDEANLGSPGTAGWVKTMMGAKYLQWLLNHEQTDEASADG